MDLMTAREFEGLTSFIRKRYGINLSNNRAFAYLRVRQLMDRGHYESFASYYAYLRSEPSGIALSDFISSLTISYSLFNRDPSHFGFPRNHVLPMVAEEERLSRDLRIWSAGCATGEEPYTIAMVVRDFFGPGGREWDTKVLASDISLHALKKAFAAVYPVESVRGLNRAWVQNYFTRRPTDPGSIRVTDTIRGEVILKKLNLVGPIVPFRQPFHCIFCRNVMLYFDDEIKSEALRRLYNDLEQGGYLFIGTTETIDRDNGKFQYVQPSIYRRV